MESSEYKKPTPEEAAEHALKTIKEAFQLAAIKHDEKLKQQAKQQNPDSSNKETPSSNDTTRKGN